MTSGGEANSAYEVAVVGHRGFLGSAITQAFVDAGAAVATYGIDSPIVRDGSLAPELGTGTVRTVVWCASRINPRLALEQPELVDADVQDLAQFLDLVDGPDAPHVVFLSSGGTVYGPPAQPPYSEADELAPINAYGAAKVRMEQLLREHTVTGTSMRIANAYGPGQVPAPGQGVLAHWIKAVRHGEPVTLYGDPDTTRDYVYVTDIASAALAIHEHGAASPTALNIGSGEATSLEALLTAFQEAVSPTELEVRREPGRSTDATHSVLDISLARESIGWLPRTSLADGVRAQWESSLP